MPGPLEGYSAERGQSPHRLHEHQLERRVLDLWAARNPASDLVFVYDYDPAEQTVDVVLMNDRRSPPIRKIPIGGAGGNGLRYIRSWKGTLQTDKPDIGVVLYPRLGGGRRFLDFIRRDTNAVYLHIEKTAVFLGGFPAPRAAGEPAQANYSATPALHQIGKNDNGLLKPSGAGFLVKDNDDLVLRGKRILMLGLDQTEEDAEPVAITGGDVPPISSRVYAGN